MGLTLTLPEHSRVGDHGIASHLTLLVDSHQFEITLCNNWRYRGDRLLYMISAMSTCCQSPAMKMHDQWVCSECRQHMAWFHEPVTMKTNRDESAYEELLAHWLGESDPLEGSLRAQLVIEKLREFDLASTVSLFAEPNTSKRSRLLRHKLRGWKDVQY